MGHSIFVYDTTLRVPLVMRGPGVPRRRGGERRRVARRRRADDRPRCSACRPMRCRRSIARPGNRRAAARARARSTPSRSRRSSTSDGPACARCATAPGSTSPRRSRSSTTCRAIHCEATNRVGDDPQRRARLDTVVGRWSGAEPGAAPSSSPEVLCALAVAWIRQRIAPRSVHRHGPIPRTASRSHRGWRMVTSGEVQGDALVFTLEAILRDDPQNPAGPPPAGLCANWSATECARAEPHFRAAIKCGPAVGRCRSGPGSMPGPGRRPEGGRTRPWPRPDRPNQRVR